MFISTIAIKRPVFTSMVILSLLVFGWVSLRGLPVELFPKVDFPIVTVTTVLQGSDPETIETRVSDPIEEAVNTISSIKKLQSTSREGVSVVVIEFQLDKNVDVAYQEVQQKVNSVRAQLPTDVEDPVIQKVDLDAAPIMSLVLSGDLGDKELYQAADKEIRERLQRVKNVGAIKINGGRDRKMWLWLDAGLMKQHSLTVRDVRTALAAQHVELPGGRIEDGRQELVSRVKAEFRSAAELDELILSHAGGSVIRLKDVGHAEDGLEEQRSYAQIDGKPCITLDVQRQSGSNMVQVADDVKAEVKKLAAKLSERQIDLQVATDMSVYVRQSVNQVYHHLIIGGGLAVFTVMIFLLNFRSTFISAMVLPASIMATFMMLSAAGFTINMMTLMALQLAIGLLIDDAIVVQENIMRHVQLGKSAAFAADFATKEIGLAVLATTLSVVAVFLPTAYTEGIVGRFFLPFGMTIAFAVMISMLVSFTLDPMLSSRLLKKQTHQNPVFRFLEQSFFAMERVYEGILGWCLGHRALVVTIAVIGFVASMSLGRFVKSEFQPEEDRAEFTVTMRAKLGSSLASTREVLDKLQHVVKQVPEVRYTVSVAGGDKVNTGSIYVRLLDKPDRQSRGMRSQRQVMDLLRTELETLRNGEPNLVASGVQNFDAVGNSAGMKSATIQFELTGPDLVTLDGLSQQMLGKMRAKGGYKDLDTTYETGRPEESIYLNRERAAQAGVSPMDVADTIRAAIGGADIGKYRDGKDRYDIAVRLLESGRNDAAHILDLQIPTQTGGTAELRTIAVTSSTSVPVEINRFNRQRQITILANLDVSKALSDAVTEVNEMAKGISIPAGYTTSWTGESEIMAESFGNLMFTMLLSVIVIYMVLASQFESAIHPFTIMLSLPLAFVGAMLGLLIFRQTINIMTFMAFIFLLGLVTKNAILLIDYANTLRHRDGMERDEAMRKAGPVRLRPILMTTFAMIFGMLPTAIGTGEGSESRQPMAVAIIGGLISSTFLTLLVVPVVYSLLDPLSEWMQRHLLATKGALEPKTEAKLDEAMEPVDA